METIQKGFLSGTVLVSYLNLLFDIRQCLTMWPRRALNWQSNISVSRAQGLQVYQAQSIMKI